MSTAGRNLALILGAYRRGALGAVSARRYADLAARGQDISIVVQLAAPLGSTVTPQDVTALASDLAAVMGGVTGEPVSADTITDAEADALFPPRTGAEADMRSRAVAAAARTLADTPDEDLHALIWPTGPQRFDHGGLRRVTGDE